MKIKCQSCGATDLYETTDLYNPDVPLHGGMLRLQDPYRKFNWPIYDGALGDKSTPRFRMMCTRCSGYITRDGKLSIIDEPVHEKIEEDQSLVCPECGKVCGSLAGLGAHMRVHKDKG